MESCSACRGQILNQNQATSNLLVAFEFLRLLYPPECAGGVRVTAWCCMRRIFIESEQAPFPKQGTYVQP